jgi:hypothetical protein
MTVLVVRTRRTFRQPAELVWPLLCNSRMDGSNSPLFRLGVPRPVQCRLPDGVGGVGSERECVSDQGVVHQRILEWVPYRRLAFRTEQTELYWRRFAEEMVESFDLVPTDVGVDVTRTTRVAVRGSFGLVTGWLLYLGLKQVHRYVFRNWLRLAELGPAAPAGLPAAT